MGKVRGYLDALYAVVVDVLEVVLVMVEANLPYKLSAMVRRLLSLFIPIAVMFFVITWIQDKIPGVKNLYPWAWKTIAFGCYFAIATFIVAWRYRYKLDHHPIVEIAETPIQDGAYYYVPVTNHGPGDVEISVTAEDVQFSQGRVDHKSFLPVKYVRWFRGSGQEEIGTSNELKICAHHSWKLYLVNIDGTGTLDNQRVCSGEILAANPKENCHFLAFPGSAVEITLNACGRPALCNKTTRTVVINIPSMPT